MTVRERPRPLASIPRPTPVTRGAPNKAPQKPRACLVLALSAQDRPTPSLRGAADLARALDARLHVLRVLPLKNGLGALFSGRRALNAVRMVRRAVDASRATRSWLTDALGSEDAVEQVAIVHGDFVEQAAAHAASTGACLIVVPPSSARIGRMVTSLACAASVPVLVAREALGGRTIIAATDLRKLGYPVLWKAAELGRRLQVPMIAVHNVDLQPLTTPDMAWILRVPRPVTLLDGPAERLARVAAQLPVDTETVVRSDDNPADAILDEARTHDADFVVVGARRRTWYDRPLFGSVASRIVNRGERSVLVLPLEVSGTR
jgi:nucleotide-binding universal stress UspA family protein